MSRRTASSCCLGFSLVCPRLNSLHHTSRILLRRVASHRAWAERLEDNDRSDRGREPWWWRHSLWKEACSSKHVTLNRRLWMGLPSSFFRDDFQLKENHFAL